MITVTMNYDDFITALCKLNQKLESRSTTLNINRFEQQLSGVPPLRCFSGLPTEDVDDWLVDFDCHVSSHGWTTDFQLNALFYI